MPEPAMELAVDAEPQRLTIAEIARRYNVSFRTLRFYEEKELLRPLRRNNDRFYSERDCTRLELILKGRNLGFTLAEIFRLIEGRAASQDTISACLDIGDIDARLRALEDDRQRVLGAIAELEMLRAAKVAARPNRSRLLEASVA